MYSSEPVILYSIMNGNKAVDWGGAIRADNLVPHIVHSTIVGNEAEEGGGLRIRSTSPATLHNSILAHNTGGNVFLSMYVQPQDVTFSTLYEFSGTNHNLPSVADSVTEVDPGFVAFSNDGDPSNDDLHLRPGSPLINAGDPSGCQGAVTSGCDPDGSLPDQGAYGGAGADGAYTLDSDSDGLYDGWEQSQAGNLTTLHGSADSDSDGASNRAELAASTQVFIPDSDGDGYTDGVELAAAKDPLNPFSVPGTTGLLPIQVPSSPYPTIQSAVDAIPSGREGIIRVAAGTFMENIAFTYKRVALEGAGEALTILDGALKNSVLSLNQAALTLNQVTVQRGSVSGYGGGLSALSSEVLVEHVTVAENHSGGSGGGMYLKCSTASLSEVSVRDNTAKYGAGLYGGDSTVLLEHTVLWGNDASDYGGGLHLDDSTGELRSVSVLENSATRYGGGLDLFDSALRLSQVVIQGNKAREGGGIEIEYSTPVFDQVILAGNTADSQGGALQLEYSTATFYNSIVAYNSASLGGNFYSTGSSSIAAQYLDLYNPAGSGSDNLIPTGVLLTAEPKFLVYADSSTGAVCTPGASTTCQPFDLHLALSSPLVNAGDPAVLDVDKSRSDPGIYGGPTGGQWDMDRDGTPDYFWPGQWSNAPAGFSPSAYDCDDQDPTVQSCL